MSVSGKVWRECSGREESANTAPPPSSLNFFPPPTLSIYQISTVHKTRVNAVAMQAGCISLNAWLVSMSYWKRGKACKIRIKHPRRNMVKNGTNSASGGQPWRSLFCRFHEPADRHFSPPMRIRNPGNHQGRAFQAISYLAEPQLGTRCAVVSCLSPKLTWNVREINCGIKWDFSWIFHRHFGKIYSWYKYLLFLNYSNGKRGADRL